MGRKLQEIQAPVASEMEEFEQKFRQSMRSNVLLLDRITRYIVKRKGKQMRPLFVFLSAGTTGSINESTYRGAALIELLHTATLVHDDVVDDSHFRRGFLSINAIWKNKIAVLVGDFLLSRGLLLSVRNGDHQLLQIVSEAVQDMSEGELLQMEKARKLDITEQIYFDIIKQKTASLITSCCKVGAASAKGEEELIERMGRFGQSVGMAFQIKDDLFDYGQGSIGKPVGIDIREKKMTLPLIHALSQSSNSEKSEIKRLVKKSERNNSAVREVIDWVSKKGGLAYAREVMHQYHSEALLVLNEFPASDYRQSLTDLVQFTIDREK